LTRLNCIKNFKMKIIITEQQYKLLEVSPSIRRRYHSIQIFLDNLMETMYVCDFAGITHFLNGVIYEAGIYYDDVDDFDGMDKGEFLETLETEFEEYIYNYYLERCNNNEDNEEI
jgi:hypothetical protein